MKIITLIQAAALVIMAVAGAYASAQEPAKTCADTHLAAQICEL